MSETGVTGSIGSTIHGILVIVAAIIGIGGYIIRSRLNQIELKKQEEQKQEEERRRAALQHCVKQLETFIGPSMSYANGISKFLRNILYMHNKDEFAENLKKLRAQDDNTYFIFVGEATLNRLKNNDEDAIDFLTKYRLLYSKFCIPVAELLIKYQYSLSEIPTQKEHDEMYPGLKGKHQLDILSMSTAAITHANYLLETWDGKTNIFKNLSLPKDEKHPLIATPYLNMMIRWQYDKLISKYEFLFKEDMKRANESILERNKRYHESFISQNYKVDVNNSSNSKS